MVQYEYLKYAEIFNIFYLMGDFKVCEYRGCRT